MNRRSTKSRVTPLKDARNDVAIHTTPRQIINSILRGSKVRNTVRPPKRNINLTGNKDSRNDSKTNDGLSTIEQKRAKISSSPISTSTERNISKVVTALAEKPKLQSTPLRGKSYSTETRSHPTASPVTRKSLSTGNPIEKVLDKVSTSPIRNSRSKSRRSLENGAVATKITQRLEIPESRRVSEPPFSAGSVSTRTRSLRNASSKTRRKSCLATVPEDTSDRQTSSGDSIPQKNSTIALRVTANRDTTSSSSEARSSHLRPLDTGIFYKHRKRLSGTQAKSGDATQPRKTGTELRDGGSQDIATTSSEVRSGHLRSLGGSVFYKHRKQRRLEIPRLEDDPELESFTESVISKLRALANSKTTEPSARPAQPQTRDSASKNNKMERKKTRTKRTRLSELHVSQIFSAPELDSFTDNVIAKIAHIGKTNKEISPAVASEVKTVSERRTKSDAATSISIDYQSETMNEEVPCSEEDISSPIGPLNLSEIIPVDHNGSKSLVNTPIISMHRTSQNRETPSGTSLKDGRHASDQSRVADTDGLGSPDLETADVEARISCNVERNSPRRKTDIATNVLSKYVDVDTQHTRPPAAPDIRKGKRQRRAKKNDGLKGNNKPQKPDLPFPVSALQEMTKGYMTRSKRLSRGVVNEFVDVSRMYFEQTARWLTANSRAGGKGELHHVRMNRVKELMARRKYITKQKPLNVLIEENFPLEYRNALIPVAAADT